MSKQDEKERVVIVGAGPVGMVCALALNRAGGFGEAGLVLRTQVELQGPGLLVGANAGDLRALVFASKRTGRVPPDGDGLSVLTIVCNGGKAWKSASCSSRRC